MGRLVRLGTSSTAVREELRSAAAVRSGVTEAGLEAGTPPSADSERVVELSTSCPGAPGTHVEGVSWHSRAAEGDVAPRRASLFAGVDDVPRPTSSSGKRRDDAWLPSSSSAAEERVVHPDRAAGGELERDVWLRWLHSHGQVEDVPALRASSATRDDVVQAPSAPSRRGIRARRMSKVVSGLGS